MMNEIGKEMRKKGGKKEWERDGQTDRRTLRNHVAGIAYTRVPF